MGEPISKEGAAVVKYCPLCGDQLLDSESKEPLTLNVQHTCPECGNSFTVRGKRAA